MILTTLKSNRQTKKFISILTTHLNLIKKFKCNSYYTIKQRLGKASIDIRQAGLYQRP